VVTINYGRSAVESLLCEKENQAARRKLRGKLGRRHRIGISWLALQLFFFEHFCTHNRLCYCIPTTPIHGGSHSSNSRDSSLLATMESSRIFVRGLPPTLTEDEFKKHFAIQPVTDFRLMSQRRIGYVGYRTPEDASKAVKYFNKSFIRMSRIAVELARPVCLGLLHT